jgi:hypothetical protein
MRSETLDGRTRRLADVDIANRPISRSSCQNTLVPRDRSDSLAVIAELAHLLCALHVPDLHSPGAQPNC